MLCPVFYYVYPYTRAGNRSRKLSSKARLMMERTVLVTGGAGFIGSHTVERFLAEGHRVVVIDNLTSGYLENLPTEHPNLRFVRGSILDTDGLTDLCNGCDAIVHLAAIPSVQRSIEAPEETHDVNYLGTLSVASAARRAKVGRIVYASSAAVYADIGQGPIAVDASLAPSSPYGVDKLAGEYLLRCWTHLYGTSTIPLRFFNVYGERQRAGSPYSGVISIYAAAALNDRPVKVFGDGLQSRDFIYVADVAEAIFRATTRDLPGNHVINVATGKSTSLLDLIRVLGELRGKPIEIQFDPARPGDIRHSLARAQLIRELLGYEAETQLQAGLAKLLAWLEQEERVGA